MKQPSKTMIRSMIANRDKLEADLRKADSDLIAAGRLYWESQGCKAFPRVDALRRAVG